VDDGWMDGLGCFRELIMDFSPLLLLISSTSDESSNSNPNPT
jgi:hypothetical protein